MTFSLIHTVKYTSLLYDYAYAYRAQTLCPYIHGNILRTQVRSEYNNVTEKSVCLGYEHINQCCVCVSSCILKFHCVFCGSSCLCTVCMWVCVKVCVQVCRLQDVCILAVWQSILWWTAPPKWLIVSCHCHKSHTHCPHQPPPNTLTHTHTHTRNKQKHTNRTLVTPPILSPSHTHTHTHTPVRLSLTRSPSKGQALISTPDRNQVLWKPGWYQESANSLL